MNHHKTDASEREVNIVVRKSLKICGCTAGILLTATVLQAASNIRMNGPQSPMPEGRLGRPAEAISGDPTGQFLVAAWEILQGTCGGSFGGKCTPPKTPGVTAVGYSADGGKTWTEIGAPYLGGDAMTSGRPWLDRGGADNQTYFLTSRAASVAAAPPAPMNKAGGGTPGGANQAGVLIYRGRFKDGVFSWTDQHLLVPSRPELDLLRSPSILAAKDGSGKVWIAVSTLVGVCGRRGSSGGQISVYRSADEGKTWEGPALVSPDESPDTPDPKDPRCGRTGAIQILPSMALGPQGELYVTWQHGPTILESSPRYFLNHKTTIEVARSLDGGRSFTTPIDVALVDSMRENAPVGYSKNTMNDVPRIAVATNGPHRGRVYVTYTTAVQEALSFDNFQLLTSSQVYLIYSDDKGQSWSRPGPLGPPVPPEGLKRFWPTVAVHDSGAVDVVYMESQEKQVTPDPNDVECKIKMVVDVVREGKASSLIDVWAARSADGGATFAPPLRVTSETTNWCKVAYDYDTTQFANFGDVLGIYTAGDRTFVVWPDGRNGVPDAYFAELPPPRK
jgi:hypothetical protein